MASEILLKQRMQCILKDRGVSVTSLAKTFGASQKTLNEQINGEIRVSFATLQIMLSNFPDLSAEWLLRGEGEMLKTDTTPLPSAEDEQMISEDKDAEIERLRTENEQLREFNALQKEYVTDLKERIEEQKEYIEEYKERIAELKKAQTTATELHVKSV